MRAIRLSLAITALVILVACGATTSPGGDSGGTPSFPPIADGQASPVVARPGTQQPRDVPAQSLDVALDGRHAYARLTWWSGVEPCNVLDSVTLAQSGSEILLTIREGATDPNAACIELAMLKSTIVDLGELTPGSWTISAFGDAAPVTVEVA
jgi:hypothetical protein